MADALANEAMDQRTSHGLKDMQVCCQCAATFTALLFVKTLAA